MVSERIAHESDFWTSGEASPMRSPRIREAADRDLGRRPATRSANGRVAMVEPARRRSQRDGEYTSCSSSAQRYGSASDAQRGDVGERVDGRPFVGGAALGADELPGALRLVADGPLEDLVREPVELDERLAEEAAAMSRRVDEGTPRVAARSPLPTARRSGWRMPRTGPMPGATMLHAVEILGVRERGQPGVEGRDERVRVVDVLACGATEGRRDILAVRDERLRPRRGGARGAGAVAVVIGRPRRLSGLRSGVRLGDPRCRASRVRRAPGGSRSAP